MSDWSSDVCSSDPHDLDRAALVPTPGNAVAAAAYLERVAVADDLELVERLGRPGRLDRERGADADVDIVRPAQIDLVEAGDVVAARGARALRGDGVAPG